MSSEEKHEPIKRDLGRALSTNLTEKFTQNNHLQHKKLATPHIAGATAKKEDFVSQNSRIINTKSNFQETRTN